MFNFKLNTLLSFCFMMLILVTGCNNNPNPIKVGVIGTMSGINSDLSVSGRRGVEVAVEEINKSGGVNGRPLELVIKDDKNDTKVAEEKFKEFLKEKISVVIGPYTSGMIVNSMNYLKYKDILILGPTISADSLSEKNDNFIRFIASTKEQAQVLNEVAVKNSHKNFAIVYDTQNMGFNESLCNNFKNILASNGGQVILTKTFSSNSNVNFLYIAESIKSSKADAVFIIANSANNAEINQQLKKIDCNIQVYSPLWSNTIDLLKKGGTSVNGMYIVGGIDIDDKSSEFLKFKNTFVEKYGESPTFSSVYSYEATKALSSAMKEISILTPNAIKNSIIKIKKYKGLQGEYDIDIYGDNTRKYMVLRIENGKFRKVE